MRALFPCLTLLLAAIDTVLSDTALPNTAAPVQLQPLGLDKAKWIWNSATPGGTRAFRKSFFAPDGKIPVRAEIICTADDAFVFFVNGREVSSNAIYKRPEYACVALAPCLNVFAIKGTDLVAGTSGVLAKVRVTYADGSTSILVTDSSWRAAPDVQPGFENLTVDDSGWDTAHSFGDYGIAPWNKFDSSIPASDISKCEAVPTKPCPCQAVCDAPSPSPSPTGNVVVKSETECSSAAGSLGYLSAVPGEGCVCKSEVGPHYCEPTGDEEQMCVDRTDCAGKREVKCYVGELPAGDETASTCPCVASCCAGNSAATEAREAEARQEREEARQARAEEKQAREEERQARAEERQAREEERARRAECGCSISSAPAPAPESTPAIPSIKNAPAAADAQIQARIKETMARLGLAPCPQGYGYVKTATGYQCGGGGHKVTFGQLGMQ